MSKLAVIQLIINSKQYYFMEKSQLERKIQKKVADMFSALEQDLDVKFPENLKIRFSDDLCSQAEDLFNQQAESEKAKKLRKALSRQDVVNAINAYIGDCAGKDAWNVELKENLKDDLGFVSLERIELMIHLEKEFGILITDDEFEEVETVEDVQILVLKKLEL